MTDFVAPQVDTSGKAPEGHDQAMMAKVDQVEAFLKQQQEQRQTQTETKLAGKFTSPAELERAYLELEKKLGSQSQQTQQPTTNLTEQKAAELVQNAGIDIASMENHFIQNGELSEQHYQMLEKVGINREFVDRYIEGQLATANRYRDSIMSKVGGAEAFQGMAQWAQANLNPAELAAYNKAVDSMDMTAVENAVLGLAFRYQQAMGRDPKLLAGGNAAASGFQSVAQLVEAMKDPRYEKDPAYRRDVEQRLARSNIM